MQYKTAGHFWKFQYNVFMNWSSANAVTRATGKKRVLTIPSVEEIYSNQQVTTNLGVTVVWCMHVWHGCTVLCIQKVSVDLQFCRTLVEQTNLVKLETQLAFLAICMFFDVLWTIL